MQRIGDRDFLGALAPHPHQGDDIAVLEDQQQRMTERAAAQRLPIEPGTLGGEAELTGDFDQPRQRDRVAFD